MKLICISKQLRFFLQIDVINENFPNSIESLKCVPNAYTKAFDFFNSCIFKLFEFFTV